MKTISATDFRCFHGHVDIPLTPITLLLGENSTGKSTLLSLYRFAWKALVDSVDIDFNEPPFDLGAYDHIAHYRGGRYGRAQTFEIGGTVSSDDLTRGSRTRRAPVDVRFSCRYEKAGAEPRPIALSLATDQGSVSITLSDPELREFGEISFEFGGVSYRLNPEARRRSTGFFASRGSSLWAAFSSILSDLYMFRRFETSSQMSLFDEDKRASDSFQNFLQDLGIISPDGRPRFSNRPREQEPHALAPVRTKPERTYNPEKESFEPEGSHVPMHLARSKAASSGNWPDLAKELASFGRSSGMFRGIDVRRFGKLLSDPFQLQVDIAGPKRNLVDVGYGVSQVLPLVVEIAEARDNNFRLLMQQPEVHLHPRAQAELATLIAKARRETSQEFILETHSDYIIDRLRYEVRQGTIPASDLSIVFLRRRELDVETSCIHVDNLGNLRDAPPDYRQFFLEETEKMFDL